MPGAGGAPGGAAGAPPPGAGGAGPTIEEVDQEPLFQELTVWEPLFPKLNF